MKIHSPKTYIRYIQIRFICNKTRNCPLEETICLNCSTLFIGNYCYRCGQKREVKQLTFKSVTSNFVSAVTNIERGFFTTIAELFLRPGKMIRDYVNGKRVTYFNPFQMLFILSAIYTFMQVFDVNSHSGANNIDLSPETLEKLKSHWYMDWYLSSPIVQRTIKVVLGWFTDSKALQTLIFLPLYAISTRIVYRKEPYNVIEYSFVICYISTLILLISTIGYPFSFHSTLILDFCIFTFVFYSFFQYSLIKTIFKVLKMYLWMLLFIVLISALIVLPFIGLIQTISDLI